MYLSTWDAIGGPAPGIGVDQAAIDNAGGVPPWNHLRAYPADGTTLGASDGKVFIVAGGAPLYLSNWAAIGGARPATRIDAWDIRNAGHPASHLRPYPADGTLLAASGGGVFVVAGGAPLYVSNWAAIGGQKPSVAVDEWDVANTAHPDAHLRPYPADGTFLKTSANKVFRVVGGAPFQVTDWSLFGGVQPSVSVDQWAVDHPENAAAHLRRTPVDGTKVRGLPSGAYWAFSGGVASATSAATAVPVDDVGVAAFLPVVSSGPPAGGDGTPTVAPVVATPQVPAAARPVCIVPQPRRPHARPGQEAPWLGALPPRQGVEAQAHAGGAPAACQPAIGASRQEPRRGLQGPARPQDLEALRPDAWMEL